MGADQKSNLKFLIVFSGSFPVFKNECDPDLRLEKYFSYFLYATLGWKYVGGMHFSHKRFFSFFGVILKAIITCWHFVPDHFNPTLS